MLTSKENKCGKCESSSLGNGKRVQQRDCCFYVELILLTLRQQIFVYMKRVGLELKFCTVNLKMLTNERKSQVLNLQGAWM